MLKIIFVYPDFESLGVEYLMAVCRADGHEVDFVYYQAEDPYLDKKVKKIPFGQIAQRISETRPHVVAFSCVTDNFQYQLQCARALKEIMPEAITVFGGIHTTALPEKVLQNPEVDCVAIGEAERSFSDLLRAGDRGDIFTLPEKPVEGILFKKKGAVIGENKEGLLADINKLPFPHKAPFLLSLKDSSHEYRIITSRGCPYSCSYCFNSYFHKLRGNRAIRQRTVDNVIGELTWAKTQHTLKYILFVDDSFTTNRQWIFEFCDRYKKEIGLPFACIVNPFYIDKEIARALSSSGCVNAEVGIESLSEELCSRVLKRRSYNVKIIEAIKALKESGIMVQVNHILGIPGDTTNIQEESLLFYNKHRPDTISIYWLTYYPKTAIMDIARQEGVLTDDDINKIEEGNRLTTSSFWAGGDVSNPKPYYSIALLLNYLPILPRWLINILVRSRLYRIFKTKNFFVSIALPRVIRSIFDQRDFRGKSHIIRFVDKIFLQKFKMFNSVLKTLWRS